MSGGGERLARAVDAGKLVVIVGPTASGKTELAVTFAEKVGGEIVSADSVQIYASFDIGSGKPTAEEERRAPHHLVSILDPMDTAFAARFATLADVAIADIRARGKVPIVCGGTFLWVKALVQGLADAPPADEAIRARHAALAEAEGRPALHQKLAEVDPASAAALHPNDLVRVSRALEIFELSGKRMSVLHAAHGFATSRYDATLFAVKRDDLDARITARTRAWLSGGWIEEVQSLVSRGYANARAMASVGYADVASHVAGTLSRDALEATIIRSTRIFARRQRTWLNRADVTWI